MNIKEFLEKYNECIDFFRKTPSIYDLVKKEGFIMVGDLELPKLVERDPKVCITVQGQAYMVNKEEAKEIYATINDFLIEDEEF